MVLISIFIIDFENMFIYYISLPELNYYYYLLKVNFEGIKLTIN